MNKELEDVEIYEEIDEDEEDHALYIKNKRSNSSEEFYVIEKSYPKINCITFNQTQNLIGLGT